MIYYRIVPISLNPGNRVGAIGRRRIQSDSATANRHRKITAEHQTDYAYRQVCGVHHTVYVNNALGVLLESFALPSVRIIRQ